MNAVTKIEPASTSDYYTMFFVPTEEDNTLSISDLCAKQIDDNGAFTALHADLGSEAYLVLALEAMNGNEKAKAELLRIKSILDDAAEDANFQRESKKAQRDYDDSDFTLAA